MKGEAYAVRKILFQRGEGDGQNQLVAGRAGGCNLAEVGEGGLDLLAPPALCHFSVGKAGGKLKIAEVLGSGRKLRLAIWAPSPAKSTAVLCPIPELAPVMKATLPFKRFMGQSPTSLPCLSGTRGKKFISRKSPDKHPGNLFSNSRPVQLRSQCRQGQRGIQGLGKV